LPHQSPAEPEIQDLAQPTPQPATAAPV
jgi:hypothetical protein